VGIDVHVRDCPQDLLPVLQAAIDERAVVERAVIPWYRERAFQDLTLRLILQRVLEASGRRGPSGSTADRVFIPTERTRQPLQLSPPVGLKRFHLYTSPYNPGAAEVVAGMERELRHASLSQPEHPNRRRGVLDRLSQTPQRAVKVSLVSTDQPSQLGRAERVLVYLNVETHTRGEASERLHGEIRRALASGIPLLLVHETRPDFGACQFKDIMAAAPEDLRVRPGGMYDELAVELCGNAHLHVSMRLLLSAVRIRPSPAGKRPALLAFDSPTARYRMDAARALLAARATRVRASMMSRRTSTVDAFDSPSQPSNVDRLERSKTTNVQYKY